MKKFQEFLESKNNEEANATIKQLPEKHQKLLKGYKIEFEKDCHLKGYPDSIGLIHLGDPKNKKIHIAAPWRYGREFALLHEIAHLVWSVDLSDKQKEDWKEVVKLTRKNLKKYDPDVAKQNEEELFCHAYAQFYSKNKVLKYNHKKWDLFIEKI
jgi:hypothetical protein